MHLENVCRNRTPLTVRCFLLEDRFGRDVGVIVARLTCELSPAGAVWLARAQSPVRLDAVPTPPLGAPTGRPASLRHASDLIDEKPGTDVLLLGSAHPPEGRGATSVDVSVRVETGERTLHKLVRAHGPRVYYQGPLGVAPGPAAEMGKVPLVHELTYGGADLSDPARPLVDARNPAGFGFARDRARLLGQPAPPLEDPRAPLSSRSPAPAAFAPIPADWAPRSGWMGTYDDAWQRERAPLRPLDFDPRHNTTAPPDLWSEAPLAGDEPVEVLGATPGGALRFRLPRYAPAFDAVIRRRVFPLPTHLDTFLIDLLDPRAPRVELTWRASVPLPRKPELLFGLHVLSTGKLPAPSPIELPSSRSLPLLREVR